MTLAEKRMFDTMMDIRILTLELEELEAEREDPNCEDVAYLSMCPIADTKYKIEALYSKLESNPAYVDEDACWTKYHELYE